MKIPFRRHSDWGLGFQILSTSLRCEIKWKAWSWTLNWYYTQGIRDYSLATTFSSCLLLLLTDTVHTKVRFADQEWEELYSQPVWDVAGWTVGTCMWTWGQMSAYRQQKRSQRRLQTLESHSTHQLCLLCLTRAAQLSNAPPALTASLLTAVSELSTYPH